jgi:hypothetical protein
VAAVLGIASLIGDSITFDEISHLTSGYSYLRTRDFRLGPGTPPLAELWCALPLLFMDCEWPPPETYGWREGNEWIVGRTWFYKSNNGESLLTVSRCMMIILLLVMCLGVYAMGYKLFGRTAGLVALILAAFSPTFLAHGRLVTTDLPITLGIVITLLAFTRLFERISWDRLLLAVLALAVSSLIKFTWMFLIPALVLMGAFAVLRRKPFPFTLFSNSESTLVKRSVRLVVLLCCAVVSGAVVWGAIWTCYGWRYSPFLGPDREKARMIVVPPFPENPPENMEETWKMILTGPHGEPMKGITTSVVRWVRKYRLLPESYVYGVAYQLRNTLPGTLPAYLRGKIHEAGHALYFPVAFAIKTPLATMLLFAAGLFALTMRRNSSNLNPILMIGLVSFTFIYGLVAVIRGPNIGHRHILPIYPAIMVFAGASSAWLGSRRHLCRLLIISAIGWLIGANLLIHPHYLGYFNELIGGPGRGHLYLADSNIDWGQDLKRLAKYSKNHPDKIIKLGYFGIGMPPEYGFQCEELRSFPQFGGKPAELIGGTYVISVTQLLGVTDWMVRDNVWEDPDKWERYRLLHEKLSKPLEPDASQQKQKEREGLIWQMEQDRKALLVYRLRNRKPDDRIGYSMFVYRLTEDEVKSMLAPEKAEQSSVSDYNCSRQVISS